MDIVDELHHGEKPKADEYEERTSLKCSDRNLLQQIYKNQIYFIGFLLA
jgi:hypothetical protein